MVMNGSCRNMCSMNGTIATRRTKTTLLDHLFVFDSWCQQHKNGYLTRPVISNFNGHLRLLVPNRFRLHLIFKLSSLMFLLGNRLLIG